MKKIGLILIVFCALLDPLVGHAKTQIIADAQEMIKDKKSQTLELNGAVNVIFSQQHLLCDRAIVYEETSTIIAEGNVVLQNGRTTLRGEKIKFNYDTNKGTLYNGVVTSGQVLIEAAVIEKIGESEYMADDAYYTACITCPPSWGFTASNVIAEIGGYAYISRPWLHLLQFPVLPLPYLVVPLNSKRQTGFLVPKPFSNGDGGFAVEQPFFWAIDRSHDATFSLINYEKRGQQALANYRYVISPTSSGQFNTAFLRDRTISNDNLKNRWFVEYGHHYDLPNDYTQRTEIALASDRKYAFDFFNQFLHNGEPALANNVSLSKAFDESLLTLEASYYQSQIEPEFGFRDDNSLHRLPEINFETNDYKLSDDLNLFFRLDAQYLAINRKGLAFEHTRANAECDTTQVDKNGNKVTVTDEICHPTAQSTGSFIYGTPAGQPAASDLAYGDMIRTGQRLDVMPRFHAPFWVGNVLDVDPSLAFRYTQYSLGVPSDPSQGYDAFPSRFYTQLGLNVKSDINRVYDWSKETRLKHSIVPEVNLRYIPKIHQTKHNFFGNTEPLRYFRELLPMDDSDSDWRAGGRGIQFDQRDRVIGNQFIDFGIANKVIRRDLSDADDLDGGYTRAFYFRVSQALDIYELRKGDDARAWQSLNTLGEFEVGPISQRWETAYFPYHNETRWSTNTRYNFAASFVDVGYTKTFNFFSDPPVNQNSKLEFLTFSTGLAMPYVYFFGSTSVDLNAGRDATVKSDPFQSWRVAMQISPPGSCWTLNAEIIKAVDNSSIMPSISMEFQFGE